MYNARYNEDISNYIMSYFRCESDDDFNIVYLNSVSYFIDGYDKLQAVKLGLIDFFKTEIEVREKIIKSLDDYNINASRDKAEILKLKEVIFEIKKRL